MRSMLKIFISNPVLSNVMMLLIVVAGILGASGMVRERFPNFTLDMVSVSVPYPGADPEEVEEGICIVIEEALDGLQGIKKITTTASEGSGSAQIELEESADLYQVLNDIKNRIDSINTFPVDAEKPSVSELKFRGDVLAVIIWGDLPERQLKELARRIERDIAQLPEVTQTSVSGIRDYEITVELSEEQMRRYGLNFDQVKQIIRDNSYNFSAGQIQTRDEDYRIRALGRKYSAKEYMDIPVVANSDGTIITLGQIAEIRDTFDADAKAYSYFNGKPAVSVNVFKTEFEDAIKISNAVRKFVEQKQRELPANVHLSIFRDNSKMVIDRIRILLESGAMGLVLVFLALWMFLDLRLSFWVTMGIPISLAGGLALMSAFDCSLNMLSLFGLIMVLGIIVDDAIVIGESIYARRERGDGMLESAIDGTNEVALPVFAAVLTTIVAFIPLFFVNGVMGKFIRQIPIPVVAALSFSLVEGLFILPVHLRHLPRKLDVVKRGIFSYPGRFRKMITGGMEFFVDRMYSPFIVVALHWRYVTLCVSVFVFLAVTGMVYNGVVRFVFFPQSDSDLIRAVVEMPPGTPLDDTRKVSDIVVAGWEKVNRDYRDKYGKDVSVDVYTVIGGSISWRGSGKPNEFTVAVELEGAENRKVESRELISQWKKAIGDLPGVYSTQFRAMRGGPGGNPIEYELRGDSMKVILSAANELLAKLKTFDGLYDQQVDWTPGKREFVVRLKPEAHAYGLSLSDVASYVRGGFYGAEALRIQRGRDDVKVKVKFPEKSGRNSIDYFNRLRIKTPSGERIPFKSVADISLEEGQSSIVRKDRQRVVNVISDINDDVANAQEVYAALNSSFIPELMKKYNDEVSWSTGGQEEERRESFKSLYVWFPLCMFGIYFIIASIFRSYVQPLVIMTTIPFGLIGGVLGHMLFGMPLTILSIFGMVALTGIVVNDAIVLIECVNSRLQDGRSLFVSLREGGKRRFRAIFLTSFTTFAGLMPIMLERSFQAQFLKPMAVAIAFGVVFATLLTLVLIPCLFVILNDMRRLCYGLMHLRWPSREEVEPRSKRYLRQHKEITLKEDIVDEHEIRAKKRIHRIG
ncbi:MAG: efflux RND transporter permease subunit [Victivallales bacterium]|nr:efflux RND transporter permease subunit [Victivallales bacterium]